MYWQGCLLFVAHTPFLFHPENILHRQHTMLINMRNKSGQSILPCHNINYLYPQIIDCSSHIIQINVQTFLPWNEPNLIQTCQNHQHRLNLRHPNHHLIAHVLQAQADSHSLHVRHRQNLGAAYQSLGCRAFRLTKPVLDFCCCCECGFDLQRICTPSVCGRNAEILVGIVCLCVVGDIWLCSIA